MKFYSFFIMPTDSKEVEHTILGFKNKGSIVEELPVRAYKLVAPLISTMLARIINDSFASGVFPDSLKMARVTPIHKSGAKDQAMN